MTSSEMIENHVEHFLLEADFGIPFSEKPELKGYVNWSSKNDLAMSKWFRYREAYSPLLIENLDVGKRVLDPFCGCGSTLVGCALTHRSSLGIDINPLATYISTIKINSLTLNQKVIIKDFILKIDDKVRNIIPWELPKLKISHKVFESDILNTLLRLRSAIEELNLIDDSVRNFLFMAWLAILEDVGSYFKEGNGIKYRNMQRSDHGYIKKPEGVWQLERFGSDQELYVLKAFKKQIKLMLDDTSLWEKGTWEKQEVITGNSIQVMKNLEDKSFNTIIFSPPYANRFDYFEAMKVELWFGNFVNSYQELDLMRKQSLRSHLGANLSQSTKYQSPILEGLIHLMDKEASSWKMGVPDALRGYFDDMFNILVSCKRLISKGKCYIVVGNSAFAGSIIPTDSLIARMGLEIGFSSVSIDVVRHLTVAPQQRNLLNGLKKYMRESILVLES